MGHYFHCVRVKAPNKDVACNYVENYVEDRAETGAIDYGFIMAVVDENGVISIEDNLFHDLRNSKTQAERDKFDVFKDTAYQGDLLSYGLTDLEKEGYAPSCYLDKDNKEVETFKTFFVWVNSHM